MLRRKTQRQPAKVKPTEIVLVEWIDAESKDEWITLAELDQFIASKDNHAKSVGFLIREDKTYLILSGDHVPTNNDVGRTIKIPRRWITKITHLT